MQVEFDEVLSNHVVARTIVDELFRSGVRIVTLSPGSRSTPLALAALAHPAIETRVLLDERSAGFFALGVAKATGMPAAVVTTSGTAVVELSPAVTEATYSAVPLVVLSADRPFELYDTGAPQTIDQTAVFAGFIRQRRLIDAGAPGSFDRIRATVSRAVLVSRGLGGPLGPVHLNISFREPLVAPAAGAVEPLAGRVDALPWHATIDLDDVVEARSFAQMLLGTKRGLVVVGECDQNEAVFAISELLGWPTMVDPRSGMARRSRYAVSYQDSFLRVPELLDQLLPEVVLYFGRPQASRVLSEYLSAISSPYEVGSTMIYRSGDGATDPNGTAAGFVVGPLERLVAELSQAEILGEPSVDSGFAARYLRIDDMCDAEVRASQRDGTLGVEIKVARVLVESLTSTDLLFASASMPMRDLEFFSGSKPNYPRVLENRGANGIDGVLASFVGAALANERGGFGGIGVLAIGDLAFLYDASFLRELAKIEVAALIVVIDNDGGGIFSFLPQNGETSSEVFEEIFGTPHGIDLAKVAQAYSIECDTHAKVGDLPGAIADLRRSRKSRVMIIQSDRGANLAAHRDINARIATALLAYVES